MKKNCINNYYAVAKGQATGIFDTWSECQRQVDGIKHNSFKGFPTLEGAVNFMRRAGIDMGDIDFVEGEGGVVLRKPLRDKFMNLKYNELASDTSDNDATVSDKKDGCRSEDDPPSKTTDRVTDNSDINTISIDGSCRGIGTDHAVGGFGIYWGENHPYNVSEKYPNLVIRPIKWRS